MSCQNRDVDKEDHKKKKREKSDVKRKEEG